MALILAEEVNLAAEEPGVIIDKYTFYPSHIDSLIKMIFNLLLSSPECLAATAGVKIIIIEQIILS